MRLVLDTNIVMDMLFFANPYTHPLETAIRTGQSACFTDNECLAELERVCTYPEFRMDAARQRALLEQYRQLATPCNATGEENYVLPRCRDGDDQKFLILAARCRADLLVTRDKLLLKLAHHRHKPVPFAIVTAETACHLPGLAPENPAHIV